MKASSALWFQPAPCGGLGLQRRVRLLTELDACAISARGAACCTPQGRQPRMWHVHTTWCACGPCGADNRAHKHAEGRVVGPQSISGRGRTLLRALDVPWAVGPAMARKLFEKDAEAPKDPRVQTEA